MPFCSGRVVFVAVLLSFPSLLLLSARYQYFSRFEAPELWYCGGVGGGIMLPIRTRLLGLSRYLVV